MTPEEVVAIIGATTALCGAAVPVFVQIRALRKEINGFMHELVDAKATAAEKEGELRGRDFVAPPEKLHPAGDIREHV